MVEIKEIKQEIVVPRQCWLVAIDGTPMYQPCYSKQEAKDKAKLKKKYLGNHSIGVAKYVAVEVEMQ